MRRAFRPNQSAFFDRVRAPGSGGEYGVTWLLPRIVGEGHAADLLLSARVIDGAEAHRMGLVNWVVDGDDVLGPALEYARDMARHCAPTSLAMLRHQLHADAQSDFAPALTAAYLAMDDAVQGAAFREGLDSYVAGRAPDFAGLPGDYQPERIIGRRLPEADHDPAAGLRGEPL